MKTALIIEDDRNTAALIKRHLSFIGVEGQVCLDGRSGLESATSGHYNLILLDVMLPEIDGISVCRQLRTKGLDTPVMMLTSRNSIEDIITGMETGADAYLAKPFSIKELQARSLALLRRPPITKTDKISIGELELDTQDKQLRIAGKRVPLRRREFSILQMLVRYAGNNVSIDRLNSATSENLNTPTNNSVHVHVSHIRERLAEEGIHNLIETVHGIGYRLNPPGK